MKKKILALLLTVSMLGSVSLTSYGHTLVKPKEGQKAETKAEDTKEDKKEDEKKSGSFEEQVAEAAKEVKAYKGDIGVKFGTLDGSNKLIETEITLDVYATFIGEQIGVGTIKSEKIVDGKSEEVVEEYYKDYVAYKLDPDKDKYVYEFDLPKEPQEHISNYWNALKTFTAFSDKFTKEEKGDEVIYTFEGNDLEILQEFKKPYQITFGNTPEKNVIMSIKYVFDKETAMMKSVDSKFELKGSTSYVETYSNFDEINGFEEVDAPDKEIEEKK